MRGAANTLIANNTLRRGTYCILIDSGSSRVTVSGNQLSSCGSGSTQSVKIVDSSNNQFLNNKLWGDPANLFDLSEIGKLMVEMGASNNNTFRGNDANISMSGRGSRKQEGIRHCFDRSTYWNSEVVSPGRRLWVKLSAARSVPQRRPKI